MPSHRQSTDELAEENHILRAQVAQLEDRLDHVNAHNAADGTSQFEELHQTVLSAVSDVVLITDDSGRLTYVSPNAHYIFGHSADDILKHGRANFVLPPESFDPTLLDDRGEANNVACQIRDAVGRARDLLVTIRRVDAQFGNVLYACRDVTERRKIELDHDLLSLTLERRVADQTKELRESRERYRRLVEGLRDEYLFYASDPQGIITYISPSIHTIMGYRPDEVIGRNWRDFIDPGHPTFSQLEELEQMRFAGVATPMFCCPIPRATGEMRVLEFRDQAVYDVDGQIVANEGIAKDVTERHRAGEALRQAHEELEQRVGERTAELTTMYERLRDSEQRYRSVVEDHLEFIVRWEGDGLRTFVNEAYCRYCKATREELVGRSFMPEIVEEDRADLQAKLARVTPEQPVVVHDHRVVLPNGRVVWQQWSHRALFNKEGKLLEFQSVGQDTTELRKQQQHARDSAVAKVQLESLTGRERDVLTLVVAGDANKIIARKLNLSIKTIEKHRSSLMKKLHVRSVPELVRLALLAEEPGA